MTPSEQAAQIQVEGLEAIKVGIAQINGKIDMLAVSHSQEREARKDQELRLRAVEARPAVPAEVEERLRAIEAKRCVTPGQLWAVVAGLLAIIVAAYPILSDYFHAIPNQP